MKPTRKHSKGSALLRIALACAIIIMILRITGIAESLFYVPTRESLATPPGYEDVWFETDDGKRLHAWFMPAQGLKPGQTAPSILHCHGNAGNIQYHDAQSRFLTSAGFNVLIFDYRGYGQSDNARFLNRNKLLLDAHAALDALIARPDVAQDQVGVLGVSLGGGFALALAAERDEVKAVCTVSAFSTWAGVAHDFIPILGPALVPAGWNPEDHAQSLAEKPYLIVHGDADKIVKVRHAHRLMDKATTQGSNAMLTIAAGADHNRMLDTHPETKQAIQAFYRATLTPNQGE